MLTLGLLQKLSLEFTEDKFTFLNFQQKLTIVISATVETNDCPSAIGALLQNGAVLQHFYKTSPFRNRGTILVTLGDYFGVDSCQETCK